MPHDCSKTEYNMAASRKSNRNILITFRWVCKRKHCLSEKIYRNSFFVQLILWFMDLWERFIPTLAGVTIKCVYYEAPDVIF